MNRSTTITSKRYRCGVPPDWTSQLGNRTHSGNKEKKDGRLIQSYEATTYSSTYSHKNSISNHSRAINITRNGVQKEEKKIYPILEKEEEPIHFILNKKSSTKLNQPNKKKHLFISKIRQKNSSSREKILLQVNSLETRTKREERRRDAKKLLDETLKENISIKINQDEPSNHCSVHPDEIVTDDDVDEEWDLARWKIRELSRVKRDKHEAAVREKSRLEKTQPRVVSETNKISNIRTAHNKSNDHRKERTKMKFLQKYYHKGAFFQANADDRFGSAGSDPIYQRNYWAPTALDNFDKTLLPVVMQVKNFGRRGRTKWTHLVAEDTSHMHVFP